MVEIKLPVRVFYELTEDEAGMDSPPIEELHIVAADLDAGAMWVYVKSARAEKAWIEGALFSYHLERGYSVEKALEMAKGPVPEAFAEDVPGWNPYDPTPLPDPDADPYA